MGSLNVVTQSQRWGQDAKGVYVDLWLLGYSKHMKSGGTAQHKRWCVCVRQRGVSEGCEGVIGNSG